MSSRAYSVAKIAFLSRFFVFALQVIVNILPDHNADAFDPGIPDEENGFLDGLIRSSLDGFHKWDAKYFLHVARHGYKEQRMFAFFPLFPISLKNLATVLSTSLEYSQILISRYSSLLLAGVIINTVAFIGASVSLYQLTLKIYWNEKFAYLCAVMFCFNPASIFFSANYTEALYSFCVFRGLYLLEEQSFMKSAIYLIGASATRSNGIVNAGFIAYSATLEIVLILRQDYLKDIIASVCAILWTISRTILLVAAVCTPFALFNLYGYFEFCVLSDDIDDIYLGRIDNDIPDWCITSLPLIYSHIQSQNWDVGFLKYYQFRKIPNILLAVPCTTLVMFGIYYYTSQNAEQVKNLGLFNRANKQVIVRQKMYRKNVFEFVKLNIFVYIVHASFLLLFGLCFMHIEVVTRFLFSSSPLPIWIATSMVFKDLSEKDVAVFNLGNLRENWRALSQMSKLVCIYFVVFFIVGTFMHVNFLPWT